MELKMNNYGMPPEIKRGEIWRVNLNPSKGSELQKIRPAIVISSDDIDGHQVKLVVPITEWDVRYREKYWYVPIINSAANGLEKLSTADTTMTRSLAVSVERFKEKLGILETETLDLITQTLSAVIETK
jgi:mRNA interferase MazF